MGPGAGRRADRHRRRRGGPASRPPHAAAGCRGGAGRAARPAVATYAPAARDRDRLRRCVGAAAPVAPRCQRGGGARLDDRHPAAAVLPLPLGLRPRGGRRYGYRRRGGGPRSRDQWQPRRRGGRYDRRGRVVRARCGDALPRGRPPARGAAGPDARARRARPGAARHRRPPRVGHRDPGPGGPGRRGHQPGAAVEALAVIEAEASRTLAEMRTVVRVLREGEDADYAPQRGVGELDELARMSPLVSGAALGSSTACRSR